MRKWFAIFCLASACTFSIAQTGRAVRKAYADSKGWLHIITSDGRDHKIRPQKWQAGGGYEAIHIAQDGKTVGWLDNQMLTPVQGATNYSYPVALELDVWRDGHVIRRFRTSALTIQNWIFLKSGSEVAFHIAPPHGQEFYDCTLFDVDTGRQLSHWSLDRRNYVVPDWAKPLLSGENLPAPGKISLTP